MKSVSLVASLLFHSKIWLHRKSKNKWSVKRQKKLCQKKSNSMLFWLNILRNGKFSVQKCTSTTDHNVTYRMCLDCTNHLKGIKDSGILHNFNMSLETSKSCSTIFSILLSWKINGLQKWTRHWRMIRRVVWFVKTTRPSIINILTSQIIKQFVFFCFSFLVFQHMVWLFSNRKKILDIIASVFLQFAL